MRAALIGLFGQGLKLAEALSRIDGAELIAGYHPDAERAKAWDTSRGVSDLSRLLADPRLDAVLIASPTHTHLDYLLACAQASTSIFVEKPAVSTYAQAERLARACEARPVPVFMVGHNLRRSGWARAIKRIIEEGRLGRLVDVEMSFSHGGAFQFGMGNWRGSAWRHREGPMNARGIHLFDLLHDWLGPVRSVYASLRNVAGVTEAPDAGATLIEMDSGVTAMLRAHYVVPSEQRFVVTGTEGIVSWERGELWLRLGRDVNRVPSHATRLACEPVDTLLEELGEFCQALTSPPGAIETTLAGGIAAVSVLEACFRSALEHRPVGMSEFPSYAAWMPEGRTPAPVTTSIDNPLRKFGVST